VSLIDRQAEDSMAGEVEEIKFTSDMPRVVRCVHIQYGVLPIIPVTP